ncbi:MAG: type II toxin-antitoxin system VapC family toxin [Solirubrobacteraceae bacterium]
MALILDSSGTIALLNSGDATHRQCIEAASAHDELIVPPLTLVEVDHWCRKASASRAFAQFIADLRHGAYSLASLELDDAVRSLELAERYADLDLGIVDASVVALSERLKVTSVLTLDRRDFSVVRPRHCASLTLLPA